MRKTTSARSQREQQLRKALEAERHAIRNAIRLGIRESRGEGTIENTEVQDDADQAQADAQTDLGLSLLQMQGERLARIGEALQALEAGDYGRCRDCGGDISTSRLQALPFATRCKACEESQEARGLERQPIPTWQSLAQMIHVGS